jgi:cellobiose phosphorylase
MAAETERRHGQVCIGGKGEQSVWLTWFFSSVAKRFANLLEALGDARCSGAL